MEKAHLTLSTDKAALLQQAARLLEQASFLLREASQPNMSEYVPEMPAHVPADQRWFWTKQWQAKEREADAALANGEYVEFDNVEDLIAHLHQQV
jgi:hypothetical protein